MIATTTSSLATGSTNPTRMLTVTEVAKLLAVSKRTVWRMLTREELPTPHRFGRNTRWDESLIRHWIDQGCPAQNTRNPTLHRS